MTLTDLNFLASPQKVEGSRINPTVPTPRVGPAEPILDLVPALTVDLSTIDWTLTGKVQAFRNTTGGDETVSLTIAVRNAAFTIAPEPLSRLVALTAAAALVASAAKRRGPGAGQLRLCA